MIDVPDRLNTFLSSNQLLAGLTTAYGLAHLDQLEQRKVPQFPQAFEKPTKTSPKLGERDLRTNHPAIAVRVYHFDQFATPLVLEHLPAYIQHCLSSTADPLAPHRATQPP